MQHLNAAVLKYIDGNDQLRKHLLITLITM